MKPRSEQLLRAVQLRCLETMVMLCSVLIVAPDVFAQLESTSEESAVVVSELVDVRPLLAKYCSDCHGDGESEGDFALASLGIDGGVNDVVEFTKDRAPFWEVVARVLRDEEMPPVDSEQPTADERKQILIWILEHAKGQTRTIAVRRLNRFEYENTIRDLFQLSRAGFSNPTTILRVDDYFEPQQKLIPRFVFAASHFAYPDRERPELAEVSNPPVDLQAEHGFTNEADSLQFSPALAEKYLELGQQIVHSPTLPLISKCWEPLFVFETSDSAAAWTEAKKRLQDFLRDAYRRPVSESDAEQFASVFISSFQEQHSFTYAMQETVAAVLSSPEFLFLFLEPNDPQLTPEQRQSYVNASRLSYFLWASQPDDELLELARQGKLVSGDQRQLQARRMLLDKKSKSLSVDFGMQWLKVNRLASTQPDPEKYPEFFGRKKQPLNISMAIEQLLLFETIMVEDRSILDFIDADFAYLNFDLLNWYGLRPAEYLGYQPNSDDFQNFYRVKLPAAAPRGGAITSGATLVLTSTSVRTSPVFRGAWLTDVIFNRPPPPPPPNVPALDDAGKGNAQPPKTIRERLEIHRNNPNCSSCHERIDPLGFALEEFDPVGKHRKNYENGSPIDSTGIYFGETVNSSRNLKKYLLQKKGRFARAFVEKILSYGLNRKLTLADEATIDEISNLAMKNDLRFKFIVEQVVASDSFGCSASGLETLPHSTGRKAKIQP